MPTEKPLPAVQAEYTALRRELDALEEKTGSRDDGETVAVTINAPREWVTLAAWIEGKLSQHRRGEEGTLPALDLRPGSVDLERAAYRLLRLMEEGYRDDRKMLDGGWHPSMFKPDASGDDLNEEIPF